MKVRKGILLVVAIFLPWLVLLLEDNPGGAFIALIMQATLIGWIPATLWAFKAIREAESAKAESTKAESAKAESK